MSSTPPTFTLDPSLTLRPVVLEDADALFALVDANRLHLRAWLPWVDGSRQAQDTREFLARVIKSGEEGKGNVWAIESCFSLCGVVGFNWIEPANRVCEIGYWLAAAYQGKAIMTRCVAELVRHAFEDLHLNRITIAVAVENQRSRAIPQRLGFQAEGVLRQAEWLYDHFVDHVMYALVRSDWHGKGPPSGAGN